MKEVINRLMYEKELWDRGYAHIMGLDEVGRGCLAGPVVAAGVILPTTLQQEMQYEKQHEKLRDSKTLSLKDRINMTAWIKEHALAYTVFFHPPVMIDRLNILQASLDAMKQCVDQLAHPIDYLLIDGNKTLNVAHPQQCIVKGDDRSASIAAASILAKTSRDAYMQQLHAVYPEFRWDKNVGYPTAEHYSALQLYGFTEHHRQSFNLKTQKQYDR
jgi:ribonuclease HII